MRQSSLARAAVLLAPLLALPALLFALSGGESRYRYPSAPREIRKLVIATPQWEGIRFEFEEGFRRWLFEHDGVGVDIVWLEQGGGSTSLRWIEEQFGDENSRESIGVDLLFGGGTDPYESLKASGLLVRYDPPPGTLDPERIPSDIAGFPLYDPDHYWFGTCLTGFGLIVNHRVRETLADRFGDLVIRDWNDLADPRLAGWVGGADPRSSSSYHTYYEIVLQQPGGFTAAMRLLREIGGNVNGYAKFSADIPKLCAVGQCLVAPTIDQYALAQIEKIALYAEPGAEDALEFVLPEGRTLVNADAVGILKGAPNLDVARRFIDYLLSDEAGYLWMLKRGESLGTMKGPVRHGLNRATVLSSVFDRIEREGPRKSLVKQNPFRMRFDFHYDYALAQKRLALVNDLLGAFLIDTQDELVAAVATWRALDGERKREAGEILFSLPFTEDDLSERLLADWNDPVKRERLKSDWTEFARARYRLVSEIEVGGGN